MLIELKTLVSSKRSKEAFKTTLAMFIAYSIALSLFVGCSTFRMEGSKHHYAWNVAGFVSTSILTIRTRSTG